MQTGISWAPPGTPTFFSKKSAFILVTITVSLDTAGYHIDMLVKTSGLTKQEYIIKRLMCEDITIHPNSRILKILCQYLTELTEELKRIEHIGQEDDVLENITYLVELIAKIKD